MDYPELHLGHKVRVKPLLAPYPTNRLVGIYDQNLHPWLKLQVRSSGGQSVPSCQDT